MKKLNVHIGEIKTARAGESLSAILGSCVGLGFIWRKKNVCGLAHCLLPESPVPSFEISGRYVDQAIKSLLALMRIRPEDIPEIEVIVTGGGNITNSETKDPSQLVGDKNFKVAIRELNKLNLNIIHSEQGHLEGKKITIFSNDFTFKIDPIPRTLKAS